MRKSIANMLIVLTALSVAVPESQAKRLGSGRSTGRQVQPSYQSQPMRQAPSTPSPGVAPHPTPGYPYGTPAQRMDPNLARQNTRPAYPNQPQGYPQGPYPQAPARQQGGSTAGAMAGGALLGFGLGSLMSRNHQQNQTADPNGNPSATSDGTATSTESIQTQQQQRSGGGGWLWWILIAAAAFFLIRRMRR